MHFEQWTRPDRWMDPAGVRRWCWRLIDRCLCSQKTGCRTPPRPLWRDRWPAPAERPTWPLETATGTLACLPARRTARTVSFCVQRFSSLLYVSRRRRVAVPCKKTRRLLSAATWPCRASAFSHVFLLALYSIANKSVTCICKKTVQLYNQTMSCMTVVLWEYQVFCRISHQSPRLESLEWTNIYKRESESVSENFTKCNEQEALLLQRNRATRYVSWNIMAVFFDWAIDKKLC